MRANATRALQHIQQFILSLANASRDGRVLLSQTTKPAGKDGVEGKTEITLKYMLLAPADSFRDVAEEARAIVLAGGTMAPVRLPPTLVVVSRRVEVPLTSRSRNR